MCILNLCFFQNLSLISTELFAYCFLPFYPLPPPPPNPHNTPQIENFEKMKKVFGYVIILHTHVYQKSRSYDVCFLKYGCDKHNFLSFWAIFCPLAPALALKIKI